MVELSDQQERARVRSRIGSLVMAFCLWQCENFSDGAFYMEDLRRYVEKHIKGQIAPDSPGRILRELRKQRRLDYTVVSRSKSLYRMKLVERPAEAREFDKQ